jgi:hypothetical protein
MFTDTIALILMASMLPVEDDYTSKYSDVSEET